MEVLHRQETEMYELVNESNRLLLEKPNLALDKVKKALEISYEIKNKRGEAFSYQTLGAVYSNKEEHNEAIVYYEKAKKIFSQLDDNNSYFKTVRYLAQAYELAGKHAKAVTEYREYLGLSRQRNSVNNERLAQEGLGRSLFNSQNFKEARDIYHKLLVAYRASDNEVKVSETYERIGKCSAGLKDTASAMKYFELAGSLDLAQASYVEQRNSYENVGKSYNKMGKYDKSVEYEKRAKKINQKNMDYEGMWRNNSNIAQNYLFMNKANEAIPLLEENIDLSQEMGELKSTGETYKALSDAYVQMGKINEARQSFEQYRSVQEQLLQEREKEIETKAGENLSFIDKQNQIELLIKDKELDEKRIGLLEDEKKQRAEHLAQQQKITYLMAGLVILLLVGLAFFYRSSKQKQLANKLLSIRSLRSQMNPHFIFNSLNSVNSFISKSDERSANKYLSEFARLMRTVLEHSKQDFVTLSAEVEVLQRYLNLEHIRFKEHFDYKFHVDENLDLDRLLIPPMLIQPYVENAIWHGLRYREEKGFLTLEIFGLADMVRIVVQDNGIGREKSKEIKTRNQKHGKSTGISNTQSRLKLLSEVHGIKVGCEISDLNQDGSGTVVEINLPKIDVDEKKYAESI